MGVLSCDRRGCRSIMCDNYSNVHGYLCNDCKEELKESHNIHYSNNIHYSIESFMDSHKQESPVEDTSWHDTVDEVFPDRYEE